MLATEITLLCPFLLKASVNLEHGIRPKIIGLYIVQQYVVLRFRNPCWYDTFDDFRNRSEGCCLNEIR